MRVESKKYLFDVSCAVANAMRFVAGKTFEDYEHDALLRSAVERQLEIVGEALAQLARIDEATASLISEYRRIIGFRNILIHGYAEINSRLVWGVLETKLPIVRKEAEALLSEEEKGEGGSQ